MDTPSRVPSTAGACHVRDAGWGPQPCTPDDPPLGQEGVAPPPVVIPPNGHTAWGGQYGRQGGSAILVASPPCRPLAIPLGWLWRVQPPSPKFNWQVWAVIPQICRIKDHFITDIILLWPPWAIYRVCHPALRMLQVGLSLSQGCLHPFERLLHCLVLWTFRDPTMHHRHRSSWVSACVQIEWGEARTDGDCAVCCGLCDGQLLYPSVRAAFNIWPQEVL